MGRLAEDMGRLRDEIESERIARQTLIADTRHDVAASAQAFIDDLKSSVDTLQAGFRESHAEMAESARADRNAFLARLGGAVADLRAQAADQQAAVRDALAESAAIARSERGQAVSQIRGDTMRMVGSLASEREAAGAAWRKQPPKAKPAARAAQARGKAHPKAHSKAAG